MYLKSQLQIKYLCCYVRLIVLECGCCMMSVSKVRFVVINVMVVLHVKLFSLFIYSKTNKICQYGNAVAGTYQHRIGNTQNIYILKYTPFPYDMNLYLIWSWQCFFVDLLIFRLNCIIFFYVQIGIFGFCLNCLFLFMF